MNDFFANIYEALYVHPEFSNLLYDAQDYPWLALILTILPLLWILAFYKLWDPSPVKRWKWFIATLFTTLVSVFLVSFVWLYMGSLSDYFINQEEGITRFALNISLYSSIFTLLPFLVLTAIVKRFSINNVNNPI